MSTIRNIKLGSSDSTVQQGGRIVHPLYAKYATQDENASLGGSKGDSEPKHNISEASSSMNSRACSVRGSNRNQNIDKYGYHRQKLSTEIPSECVTGSKTLTNLNKNGYHRQKLSTDIPLDGGPRSKVVPEPFRRNSERRAVKPAFEDKPSSSATKDNITEKNKKSSVEPKRFYQRKFSGFSSIKFPVGKFFKLLRPDLQRRNSCPVLSISELQSGRQENGASQLKLQTDTSARNQNGDINSQRNLKCRLTKWTSHSELLHSEINRHNIACELVFPYAKPESYTNRSDSPAPYPESCISSLKVQPNGSLEKSDRITNFATNSRTKVIQKVPENSQAEKFAIEKTVIIVSENTAGFLGGSNKNIFCNNTLKTSHYISNIETSMPSMNYAPAQLHGENDISNIECNTSQNYNSSYSNQVKVINSIPCQNNQTINNFQDSITNLDQFSLCYSSQLESPKKVDENTQHEFQGINIIEPLNRQQSANYSDLSNLEIGRLHSTNSNLCTLHFTQEKENTHQVASNYLASGNEDISDSSKPDILVERSKTFNTKQGENLHYISDKKGELEASPTIEIQNKVNKTASIDSREAEEKYCGKYTSCEPLYAVVNKDPNYLNLQLNNHTDGYQIRGVDTSNIAYAIQCSENNTNRTVAYFGCTETIKSSINTKDDLKVNQSFHTREVNNTYPNEHSEQNQIESTNVINNKTYNHNVLPQNRTGSNLTDGSTLLDAFNERIPKEIKNNKATQPEFISIVYNNIGGKNLSETESEEKCQNSILEINSSNGICAQQDVLNFGECSSNTSLTDLQNSQITECYNVKLDAPEEVIVAGFHDFCHTTLSLEESIELQDTGATNINLGENGEKSKPTTEANAIQSETLISDGFENENNNMPDITTTTLEGEMLEATISTGSQAGTTTDTQARTSPGTQTRTSQGNKRENSCPDKILEEIQNSKILGKMNIKDPDVIEAISALDRSLMEISAKIPEPVTTDISLGRNPEPKSSREKIEQKTNSPGKVPKEDKIQCDNLIEELMLEDISKRVTNPPQSLDSVNGTIAVTISNSLPQIQQDYETERIDPNSQKNVQNSENSDYWLSAKLSRPLKINNTISEVNSCNLHELSSDISGSDLYEPHEEAESVNRISDTKDVIFSTPTSIISGNTSAVYPLQVTVDHSSSALLQDGTICNRTSPCSVDSGTSSHNQTYFVVVAIDFGTTYSGYAFSFTRDPENIHMMKKWDGGDPGVFNQKTPTTLLLSPESQFHSFGYSARDYYHDLDEEEAKDWLYFEKFKMTLHYSEHLSLDTEIAAANGKCLPAVTVFAHALRYFKEHALQELADQSATRILNEDVRWVVTVPAIWKQPAKQFMRAAAYKAGIASPDYPEQLLIALEPEAASIYCRRMRLHQLVPNQTHFQRPSFHWHTELEATTSEKDFSFYLPGQGYEDSFNAGTRYMVVDCGGGTVDITVHELLDKQGTLKELRKASGGPYGSIGVDMEFEILLCDIFGEDFIEQFKAKRPMGYVDLMAAFEARKRTANPYQNNPLNISLPFSFIDYYKTYKGSNVETALKKSSHKNVKWSSQGMLRLESSAMEALFRRTVENIRKHIEDIINQKDMNIEHIFLVGGFAESLILQKEIKDAFYSTQKVIIPQGVSLAILKGAVLFGLDPTTINIRRLRMTYGVGVLNRFIHGVHPREKLVVKNGIQWCADVFDKFVVNEQSVDVGDVVVRRYTPAKDGQSCSVIHIYSSEKDYAYFITDPGVKRCATLILDLSDSRYVQSREIQTQMMFGDTEIKVSALDVTTGKCVKAEVDFLNQ